MRSVRRDPVRLAAAFSLLAACYGTPGTIDDLPEPLPPNTSDACERAIECGAIADNVGACVACIERSGVAPQWNARMVELYGDPPPPLELASCSAIADVASYTNLATCVVEDWFRRDR